MINLCACLIVTDNETGTEQRVVRLTTKFGGILHLEDGLQKVQPGHYQYNLHISTNLYGNIQGLVINEVVIILRGRLLLCQT